MSKSHTFRSAFNGFNRHDVTEYIEVLIKEKQEAVQKAEQANQKITELENQLKKAQEALQKSMSRCDECEIKNNNKMLIGSAMLEAKRFSDLLIKEACDKADKMYTDSAAQAQSTRKALSSLEDTFKLTRHSTLTQLTEIEKLIQAFAHRLDAFCAEAEEKKKTLCSDTKALQCTIPKQEDENKDEADLAKKESPVAQAAVITKKKKELPKPEPELVKDTPQAVECFTPNFEFLSKPQTDNDEGSNTGGNKNE